LSTAVRCVRGRFDASVDVTERATPHAVEPPSVGCRDLIPKYRGPANQSPIVLWTYPIDPWPGGPLPDEYDLLIYFKDGNRPQLLEHLSKVFPQHV
jgi:hypothetical protein